MAPPELYALNHQHSTLLSTLHPDKSDVKFLAQKLAAFGAILVFLAPANVVASSGFPSEQQLSTELRPGMTIGEAIQRFGQPGSQVTAENGSFLYRYVAPGAYLTAEKEGYIGFELHFVEGHLHDWRTFRGYPSYAPIRLPSALKWDFRIWMIIAAIVAIYGAIHKSRSVKDEDQALLEAYANKRLQTKRLPEFQFITHETTVQNVIDRLGEPTRIRKLSFDSIVGARKAAAHNVSGMSIDVLEYNLPYSAAAVVMPDYPNQPENKIRAVFYRGPKDEEGLNL